MLVATIYLIVWIDCSIKGVKVPMVILHAVDDGIVPYELGRKVSHWAVYLFVLGVMRNVVYEASTGCLVCWCVFI